MTRSGDFSATTRKGRKHRRGSLVTYFCPADSVQVSSSALGEADVPTRVGLIVNRRVGNAVARHRVSRVLRHRLADRIQSLNPGSRLVVRVLPGAGTQPNAEISRDLDFCLSLFAGGLDV
jgi:ribonuclease P protein component